MRQPFNSLLHACTFARDNCRAISLLSSFFCSSTTGCCCCCRKKNDHGTRTGVQIALLHSLALSRVCTLSSIRAMTSDPFA